MTDLVGALLQGREPSGDEGEDEVVGPQLVVLHELADVVGVGLELPTRILRIILPVELLKRRPSSVVRKVEQIDC